MFNTKSFVTFAYVEDGVAWGYIWLCPVKSFKAALNRIDKSGLRPFITDIQHFEFSEGELFAWDRAHKQARKNIDWVDHWDYIEIESNGEYFI